MKLPLNRTTAPQVIRLFDACFKHGVLDACAYEDDYYVREFLTKHKSAGDYGLVHDDENFDWRRWRYILERWCREDRVGTVGETYIGSMHMQRYIKTYMFAVIPMTMRFYLMGVEEWLEYPNPYDRELFKQTKKIHWKLVPKHLKVIKTCDFLSYLQEFIYERQNMHLQGDLSESQYDSFSRAMFALTRKYEISYGAESEEDFTL